MVKMQIISNAISSFIYNILAFLELSDFTLNIITLSVKIFLVI